MKCDIKYMFGLGGTCITKYFAHQWPMLPNGSSWTSNHTGLLFLSSIPIIVTFAAGLCCATLSLVSFSGEL